MHSKEHHRAEGGKEWLQRRGLGDTHISYLLQLLQGKAIGEKHASASRSAARLALDIGNPSSELQRKVWTGYRGQGACH